MTALILYVLLWLWDNRNFDSITKANERKLGAEQAYDRKEYREAAKLYRQITYGSIFSDPAARLNMAHSYYLAGKYSLALQHYELLKKVDNKSIASTANSQIAMIQVIQKDTGAALGSLKTALRLESGNDIARLNYITLKRNFSGVEKPSEVRINKEESEKQIISSQKPPAASSQTPKNQEVEESVKKEQLLNSLRAMNMSEDQAKAILDAMKSNESQYIYQLQRKQYAKKPKENDRIEW
ncbi:hypothetical protein [Dyadobacter sp. NIV53]|uniref:hypothetical protein n=1 Tax=Dyadobacter sp. NIV53 TaxID=2861765 RepID=UPI001C889A07|nr:hypothetical protein [Dyadobacter sp. NIV53]